MDLQDEDAKPLELPISRRPQARPSLIGQVKELEESSFKPRDPRFDPRCAGSNDVRHFVRNYAFVDDVRRQELQQLEKAFRKERDQEKKQKIKQTMQRMRNKMVEHENKSKRFEIVEELKKKKKVGNSSSISSHHSQLKEDKQEESTTTAGDTTKSKPPKAKRFNNIKKSEIKKTLLVSKYKELKESGKLTKYLERKRKKLIQRDGKAFSGD